MLVEIIKEKINSLKARQTQLVLTPEDKLEIERKVAEYRDSLLKEKEASFQKEKEVIEAKVSVLEELLSEEKVEESVEEEVVVDEAVILP